MKKSNLKKAKPDEKQSNKRSPAAGSVATAEVSHAQYNTAILASQSLPNNSVQNLLVGHKGEHLAENISSLFKEYYTDPAVMSRLSRQQQNDALHKQLSAFQRIVNEMEAHFSYSPATFHSILLAIVNDMPHTKNMLKLGKLRQMHQERVSDAQKVTGGLRDIDRKTKIFFESYLNEIQYHKRLQQLFCQRVYCPLYQYYYDEFDDLGDTDDGYQEQVVALAKMNRVGVSKGRSVKGKDRLAESDLILNRKEYLIGNYKAVLSWSEKRKLSYAADHLFSLNQRWQALLDDNGEMAPDDFEPESSENMDQFSNYPAFEPILRLMPDLYVKVRKAIELSTLWWTAGNKLFPANPDQMVERPDTLKRIADVKNRVSTLSDELANIDQRKTPYQNDLDILLSRDNRFNRLAADYENLASLKHEKMERLRKLEDKINELDSNSPYWARRRANKQQKQNMQGAEVSQELERIRELHSKTYRSLRLVAYQFEVASGDYLAELTIRPTFVRFLDSIQQKLTSSENDIGNRRTELARLQRELRNLMKNYNRKRDVLEKYLTPNDTQADMRLKDTSITSKKPAPPREGAPQRVNVDRKYRTVVLRR